MAAVLLSFVCVGFLLIPVLAAAGLAGLVLAVVAGLKANDGKEFHYPLTLTLIR